MDNKEKIDFVILWVDGNDVEWKKERDKYSIDETDKNEVRFRDWELLKYWFRGVEKYAPWVNRIFFITYGHVPNWLNTNYEKIKIVKHSDFIPKEYLPTFNSNVIELNLNKIKDLSEKFVLFNDDVFIWDYIYPNDFFVNNKVKDIFIENPIIATYDPYNYTQYNNMAIINSIYNKNLYKRNKKFYNFKYGIRSFVSKIESKHEKFVGFYNQHISQPYFKESFNKLWKERFDICNQTSLTKFRNKNNISHYVIRYMQMLDGKFEPRNFKFGKSMELSKNNYLIYKQLLKNKYKIICINDSDINTDFENTKKELLKIFGTKFPKKSKFEKGDN